MYEIDITHGLVSDVRPMPTRAAKDGLVRSHGSESAQSVSVADMAGLLLLPALQEHHAHLDKALTADTVPNATGDLMGAIRAWVAAEDASVFDEDEMQQRAEESIRDLIHAGVARVRTHVNVGASDPHMRNLRAVDAARRSFADLIDVEIVALLHSPLAGHDGVDNRRSLDAAIEFGVDLIGGCPHLEPNSEAMIDHVLRSAESAGLGVDLHVDEGLDPNMLTIETLCRSILDSGFPSPVTASHCVSLTMQTLDKQKQLAGLIASSGVRIVALPQTNLFLQGRDHPQAMPRGIAPLRVLADHGVDIAAGGDNVQDPFNPMGRHDPLETASLLVIAAHMDPLDAFDAVSTQPVPRSASFRGLIGQPADFVAVPAHNVRASLALGPAARTTIRRGRVIARTTMERHLVPPQA